MHFSRGIDSSLLGIYVSVGKNQLVKTVVWSTASWTISTEDRRRLEDFEI